MEKTDPPSERPKLLVDNRPILFGAMRDADEMTLEDFQTALEAGDEIIYRCTDLIRIDCLLRDAKITRIPQNRTLECKSGL